MSSDLSQNISGKFGGGRVAREATERALRQMRPGDDPAYDAMFEERMLPPSGIDPRQHDPLDAEAFQELPMGRGVPPATSTPEAAMGQQYVDEGSQMQQLQQQRYQNKMLIQQQQQQEQEQHQQLDQHQQQQQQLAVASVARARSSNMSSAEATRAPERASGTSTRTGGRAGAVVAGVRGGGARGQALSGSSSRPGTSSLSVRISPGGSYSTRPRASPSRSGTSTPGRSASSPGQGRVTASDRSESEGTGRGPRYVTRRVRISSEPSYPTSSRSSSQSPPQRYYHQQRLSEQQTGVRSPVTSPNGPNGRVGIGAVARRSASPPSTSSMGNAYSAGRPASTSSYGASKYLTSGYPAPIQTTTTSTSSARPARRPRRPDTNEFDQLTRPTLAASNRQRQRETDRLSPSRVRGRPAFGGGGGARRLDINRATATLPSASRPTSLAPTRRPAGRASVPAWAPQASAPASGADLTLQQPRDDAEATIIAETLNQGQRRPQSPEDGPVGRTEFSFSPSSQAPQLSGRVDTSRVDQTHPNAVSRVGRNSGVWHNGMLVQDGVDQHRLSLEREEEVFQRYRTKEHRSDLPSFKYSQPRSSGPHVMLSQKLFGFDEAHPGIAEQHFLRSPEQNKLLEAERLKEANKLRRATEKQARQLLHGSSPSGVPSAQRLRADVSQLSRSRQAGRNRLRELEEEAEGIRFHSREVEQRAMDAIAYSERITSRSRSPSPGASRRAMRYRPSRSHSPPGRTWSRSPGGGFGPGYRPATAVSSGRSPGSQKYRSAAGGGRPLSAPLRPGGMGHEDLGQLDAYSYDQYDDDFDDDVFFDENYEEVDRLPQPAASRGHSAGGSEGGGRYTGDEEGAYKVYSGGMNGGLFVDDAHKEHREETLVERLSRSSPAMERMAPSAHGTTAAGAGRQAPPSPQPIAVLAQSSGPSLTETEFLMASGAYDPEKYAEYNRQVDMEMERRAVEEGYDSDQEREQQAMEALHSLTDAQREELDRQNEERMGMAHLLQSGWEEQNSWMDYYRSRLGPQDGYRFDAEDETLIEEQDQGGPEPRSTHSSPGPRSHFLVDQHSPRGYLSEEDERMLQQPILHSLAGQYRSGTDYGTLDRLPPANIRHSMWKATVPLAPFSFEEREKNKRKSIGQVKFEQDRALKQREDDAIHKLRFQASPVPKSCMEPRYAMMAAERELRRQINREQRIVELQGQIQQPFSFDQREAERQAQRQEYTRQAKDPNRFQVPFQAKDVPLHIRQERFKLMQIELEEKRADARARAEMARQHAKERVKQETQERAEAANRAYKNRLHAVDPIWNQRYETRPPGAVPDFNRLHGQWDMDAARLRANNRRRITVPNEFRLNGGDPREQSERQRKALERRQRIILDMQLDAELLPEMRWPYTTPRGRVRPVPPPADVYNLPDYKIAETRSNMLRIAHNKGELKRGQYDMKDERDRKALARARQEAMVRADTWMKIQQEIQRKKGGGGDVDICSLGAGVGGGTANTMAGDGAGGSGLSVAERREALAGRSEAPVQYIEARHAQADRRARGIVEDELLKQGLDTYKYVEG